MDASCAGDHTAAGRAEFSGRSRMRTTAVTAAAALSQRFRIGRQEIAGPPTLDQSSSVDRGPATPCLRRVRTWAGKRSASAQAIRIRLLGEPGAFGAAVERHKMLR